MGRRRDEEALHHPERLLQFHVGPRSLSQRDIPARWRGWRSRAIGRGRAGCGRGQRGSDTSIKWSTSAYSSMRSSRPPMGIGSVRLHSLILERTISRQTSSSKGDQVPRYCPTGVRVGAEVLRNRKPRGPSPRRLIRQFTNGNGPPRTVSGSRWSVQGRCGGHIRSELNPGERPYQARYPDQPGRPWPERPEHPERPECPCRVRPDHLAGPEPA